MCKPCLHVHRCFRYRAYICGFLPVSPPVEVCNSSVCTGTKVCLRVCTGMRLCACTEECNPSQREPMKETGGAKPTGLPHHTPPPCLLARSFPPHPLLRYLLYSGCQVVAAQQNKVSRGQTWASAFSTNEGVLPCTDECVQVFACTR